MKTSNSSQGHKISTRDGSEIDSDLTYKFEKLDRSSQGVFVSKNQTKVTYPPSTTRASARFTPAIFPLAEFTTPQDYQPHPLVPSLAASTMARSRGGTANKNLNFKLGHYNSAKILLFFDYHAARTSLSKLQIWCFTLAEIQTTY
jgi:hypothetical protein